MINGTGMAVAISVPLPFIDTELNGKSRKGGRKEIFRMYLCALCDFARVLSRICLLRGIFIARPPRSQRYIYPCETFAHYAQPSYKPLVTGTIKFGLIKIKKTLLFSMFFLHLYVKKIIFPKIRNYHPIHD